MSSHPSFEPLPGPEGQSTPVLRHGDTVLRPAGPWTPAVHALLIHLENAGFTGSPRVVGNRSWPGEHVARQAGPVEDFIPGSW